MNFKQKIAGLIVIVAFLLWGAVLLIPFIDVLDITQKAAVVTFLIIAGEVLLWLGVLLVGREVIVRYKSKLFPKNWFKKSKESNSPKKDKPSN
ncbi:MAG: transporter suffix domain-containing protein [Saccharospirillaceae bacterium]|nr:transporter suffix domain-containing protein [Pseudomonadales bacterium]NRB77094.1 transporter suffix domain-containing protein [Saccharospirillaceae bacterium]